jgi:hypothetical protein
MSSVVVKVSGFTVEDAGSNAKRGGTRGTGAWACAARALFAAVRAAKNAWRSAGVAIVAVALMLALVETMMEVLKCVLEANTLTY